MWWFGEAAAHVGDIIAGLDLFADATTAYPVVEASYGLLVPAPNGGYAWVCHEAVTAPKVVISPRYARSSTGVALAFVNDAANGRDGATLFRSEDGCSWPSVPSLVGHTVSSAAFDAEDPTQAWAVTSTPQTTNAIWRSTNGGATFSTDVAPIADRRFHSVLDAGGEVWATATDEAGARLFLWHHNGVLWVEAELIGVPSVVAPTDLRILDAGPLGEVFLVSDPFGADLVLRAGSDGAFTVVFDTGGWINDAAWDGERLWIVRDATRLTTVWPDGATTDAAGFPPGTNLALAGGTLWTAPSSYVARSLLARSDDEGASFTTVAYPDDIAAPLACPAGSDAAVVCDPLWSTLLTRIRGFDEPPVEETADTGDPVLPPRPDEPPGCGCEHGQPSPAWALFTLLWWRRAARG